MKVNISKSNTRLFSNFYKLLGIQFEGKLFNLAENYTDGAYVGGHWKAAYFGKASIETYFPIVPNDTGKVYKICNTLNYFDGYMTDRALGLGIYLIALSDTSFEYQGKTIGDNATHIYHALRDRMYTSAESSEKDSLTEEEITAITKFLL